MKTRHQAKRIHVDPRSIMQSSCEIDERLFDLFATFHQHANVQRLDDPMIRPAASSLLFSLISPDSIRSRSLSSWALRTSRNKSRESRSCIVPEQTASLFQQGSIERRPPKSPIHRSSVFAETAGSRVLDALACRTRSRRRRTKRERERERKTERAR